MILASDLMLSVRLKLSDPQGTLFSDYQLLEILNASVEMIYDTLIGYANSLPRKVISLTLTDGRVDLPEDFHSLSHLSSGGIELRADFEKIVPDEGTYRVVGTKLLAPTDTVDVEYYYIPLSVTDFDGEFDIPISIRSQTVSIACALLRGDSMAADNVIYKLLTSMASRGISHIPDNIIWR